MIISCARLSSAVKCCMKPLTREWVAKAEDDWPTVAREERARTDPNQNAFCFHGQLCAEKYQNADLQEAGIVFARTHNVADLLSLLLPIDPEMKTIYPALAVLASYAVEVRYLGSNTSRVEAHRALRACRDVRVALRTRPSLVQ